jgi:hypothetical protein
MQEKQKIEFIDAKIEKEEIQGFSLKGFLDGSLLTMSSFVKQIPFILFLVSLALLYIANRYHAEKMVRRIDALKTEVKDLRAEEITAAAELMIEDKGLGLKTSNEPPFVIKKN